jgi:hypothetical protein
MAENKSFGGFDSLVDTFLPSSESNEVAMIDPEDIKKEMEKLDETVEPDDSKKDPKESDVKDPDKSSKPDSKKSVEKDAEDEVLETIDTNTKKVESIESEDGEEIEYEEADLVDTFADLFAEELDWKFEEGEKPRSVKELVEYMQNVIEENSTPKYADDDVKALDEFVKQGGKLSDYYSKVYAHEVDIDAIDLTKESNQKSIIKESLLNKGYSEPRIEKLLNRYEESGALEEEAQESLEEIKEYREKTKLQLLETQKKHADAELKQQQEFISNVQKIINEAKDVRGFELSKKEKQDLVEYIFKPEKDGMTKYQKEYNNDLRNLVESAFFTMKGKDFVQQIQKKATADATKSLKLKLKTKGKSTKNTESEQVGNNDKVAQLWEIASRELKTF